MLYLHIGTAKAGSTTIQDFHKEFQTELPYKQLETFGVGNAWKIAAAAGTPRAYWFWVEYLKKFSQSEYLAHQADFWANVKAEVDSVGKFDYIASSEHIYGNFQEDLVAIKKLRDELISIFGKVKVLIYLRNQVDFVKSLYSQRIKGPYRDTMTFERYMSNLEKEKIPIDYLSRLSLWAEAFGWENLEPIVFERKNFPNGDLLEDYCKRTGIQFDQKFTQGSRKEANVSPSFSELEVLRLMNIAKIHYGRKYVLKLINAFVPKKDFPSKFDQEIRAKVSVGNKFLNDKFFSNLAAKLPVELEQK